MAQIRGAALTLLLALTVTLLFQDASAFACCRNYSTKRVPFKHIRGYSIQTIRGKCNIPAIIFHTNQDRNVCTNPAQPWVLETIRKLKEKVNTLNQVRNV